MLNGFGAAMDFFSVNGTSAGGIPAWNSQPGTVPLFTPAGLAVTRVLNPSEGSGRFFNGKNAIILSWNGALYHFAVPIDGTQHPLQENLALFVFVSEFLLLDSAGVLILRGTPETGPAVRPSAIDLPATERGNSLGETTTCSPNRIK